MMRDLPNLLTVSRIAAIPLMVVLASFRSPGMDFAACVVFGIAGITDYFDGKLARDYGQTSDLGRMLDPIADKLLVGAALMMLVGTDRLSAASLYPAIVIMLREILVSGLREYLAGIRIGLPVTGLAKWKTGFQMGALGTLLAGDTAAGVLHISFLPVSFIGETMLWIAAILTIITGWDYLRAGFRHASATRGSAASAAMWSRFAVPIGPRASASDTVTPWRAKSSTNTPAGAREPKSIVVPARSKATSRIWEAAMTVLYLGGKRTLWELRKDGHACRHTPSAARRSAYQRVHPRRYSRARKGSASGQSTGLPAAASQEIARPLR